MNQCLEEVQANPIVNLAAVFVVRQKISALPIIRKLNAIKTIVAKDRRDFLQVIDLFPPKRDLYTEFFELHSVFSLTIGSTKVCLKTNFFNFRTCNSNPFC